MAASNETGGLKDEMTGLDLYILAQGIDLGNFSGCDNFLYKCLPKSNTNVKFCGCLEKAHWNSSLTKSLTWKQQHWSGNNEKLNIAENTSHIQYASSHTLYQAVSWQPKKIHFLFVSSSSYIFLHLQLLKARRLALTTDLDHLTFNTRHHARRTWRISWIGSFNTLIRH